MATTMSNSTPQDAPGGSQLDVSAQTDKSDYSRTSPPESWGTGIRVNSAMSRSKSIGATGLPNS